MPVMPSPLGCIADVTGAVDVAARFRNAGFRVDVRFQVPRVPAAPASDIFVIGLKSRMKPVEVATAESIAALNWLAAQGCLQFYLKYASTFDCSRHGNIGQVIEASMSRLGVDFTVACPALPSAGRTTHGGTHYVEGVPLSESYMRHHPITPMKNSDLVAVLQEQTIGRVGLLPHATVSRSTAAIRKGLERLKERGCSIAIIDAMTNDDLERIGAACSSYQIVTGSSGLALALMRGRAHQETFQQGTLAHLLRANQGPRAVISGSCSEVTRRQVDVAVQRYPAMKIDPLVAAAGYDIVNETLSWASEHLPYGPIIVYSTSDPTAVERVHDRLGSRRGASIVESTLTAIAEGLARQGVSRMIVAGGETSGAVLQGLGIQTLELGPTIKSGVSWTLASPAAVVGADMALLLKPGNFGDSNLFLHAWNTFGPTLTEGEGSTDTRSP